MRVVPRSKPKPGGESAEGKVDARSERWREHRKKVRAEIVDAAFRAIDLHGPEVSVREIAEEAGTAKPKIYRHFTDKSDLFQAIGERLRDMLWAEIYPVINLTTDSAHDVIRRSISSTSTSSTTTPTSCGSCCRADSPSRPRPPCVPSTRAARSRWRWRSCSTTNCAKWNSTVTRSNGRHATFGTAASATDWWLGPGPDSPRRMPRDKFISHLTTIMMGAIIGTTALLGIRIDPALPIHKAVPRVESTIPPTDEAAQPEPVS